MYIYIICNDGYYHELYIHLEQNMAVNMYQNSTLAYFNSLVIP